MTLFSLLLRLQIIPRFTVFILNLKHKLMHVLAYNCSIVTCPNITRHMIWRHTFLSFHSPGMECYQNWVFTLLCNQLVPLPFQPHCKSLPSLDRQTVPCLEHFSIGVASFWGKATRILSTVTFTSAKRTRAFPMIHCRFVHCNYIQKLEKAGMLVVQVADAKAH